MTVKLLGLIHLRLLVLLSWRTWGERHSLLMIKLVVESSISLVNADETLRHDWALILVYR